MCLYCARKAKACPDCLKKMIKIRQLRDAQIVASAMRRHGTRGQASAGSYTISALPQHIQTELDHLQAQIDEVDLDMRRVHKADKIQCRELARRYHGLLEDKQQILDGLAVRATMIHTYTVDLDKFMSELKERIDEQFMSELKERIDEQLDAELPKHDDR
jgi:hypothetical protein